MEPEEHYHVYKCLPPVPVLSQINPVHALHPTSKRSILILSSHISPGLPSGLFPSYFPIQTLYAPLFSSVHATWPACLVHFEFITFIIFDDWYRSLSSLLLVFSTPCYLVPLKPKYSPQFAILGHSQPMFLLQQGRPSFTPIQNNRQNYSSVHCTY